METVVGVIIRLCMTGAIPLADWTKCHLLGLVDQGGVLIINGIIGAAASE
jgi:hypothetical protein